MINAHNDGTIRLVRNSDSYWRVTFDIPPLNIFGPANIPQLEEIVRLLESDERVKVVVFDSAVEGFFLTHYNFLAKPEELKWNPPTTVAAKFSLPFGVAVAAAKGQRRWKVCDLTPHCYDISVEETVT